MKIMLDECVPWPMRKIFAGHHCTTAGYRGWGGYSNGKLLSLAETEFELFVTADQNLRYQQNMTGRRLGILELSTNDLRRIMAAADAIREAVEEMTPGEYRRFDVAER